MNNLEEIEPRFDSNGLPKTINVAYVTDPGDPEVGIFKHTIPIGKEDEIMVNLHQELEEKERPDFVQFFRQKLSNAFKTIMDNIYVEFDFEIEEQQIRGAEMEASQFQIPDYYIYDGPRDKMYHIKSALPLNLIESYFKEYSHQVRMGYISYCDFTKWLTKKDNRLDPSFHFPYDEWKEAVSLNGVDPFEWLQTHKNIRVSERGEKPNLDHTCLISFDKLGQINSYVNLVKE